MILLQSKNTRNPVKASQFRLAYLTVTITVLLHILSHGHLHNQECAVIFTCEGKIVALIRGYLKNRPAGEICDQTAGDFGI